MIYSQNLAIKLKQKYILWNRGCKIHLRFLKIIFIFSARHLFVWVMSLEGFCLFFRADFYGPKITSHILFIFCFV